MVLRALLALALVSAGASAAAQAPADPATALLLRLEEAALAGDRDAILALAAGPDTGIEVLAEVASPVPARIIIKERDRVPLTSGGERLMLELLVEHSGEGTITTWRVDTTAGAEPGTRRIAAVERLSVVSGLHQLSLDTTTQFEVRNLTMKAIDLTIELPSGHAFVAETAEGPTAVVLLGRGRMHFTPSDPAERTQVRIFAGSEALVADFDAVFVRLRPADFPRMFGEALTAVPVVASQARRALEIFEQYVGQTYQLDLTDLSRERWSLVPGPGDLIVEVRTRRHGSLTYARSTNDAEDISLFDRRRRRNISVYASPHKLAVRGRFYSEDDLIEYDVLRYAIDARFTPDRLWVDGYATLVARIRAHAVTTLTLRLAEPLVVRSVTSPELGRLLHLRVVGQNSVVLNLPTAVPRDTELTINVDYGGRLEPQQIDREVIGVSAEQDVQEIYIPIEPQYIYSNRSYWYPQSTVTDYATAQVQLAVPVEYDVVATGTPRGDPVTVVHAGERPRKVFQFEVGQPARYLSFVVSRFTQVSATTVSVPLHAAPATGGEDATGDSAAATEGEDVRQPGVWGAVPQDTADVALAVQANPRQFARARGFSDLTADIVAFYAGIIGDAPYPAFTLAVTESELPGGHSPAYFAVLNQPPPLSPLVWRNDPVAFDSYPPFFLAHEIAHQWWGQAVGWKNYREQWLSEGFAQYFAVLYAARDRGDDLKTSMLRQMRRWAIEQSPQGPVHLGYRLGHIRGDSRVFRALIYNKGAMVLHMLRHLVGDEAFFDGVRAFYQEWRFRKAGTDDLRVAMERVSGMALGPFFEGWIYGTAVPSLRFTSSVSDGYAAIRLEHQGPVVPVPVTVTLVYTDGRSEDVIIAVTERVAERTVKLAGAVRSIGVNRDFAAVAEIGRR